MQAKTGTKQSPTPDDDGRDEPPTVTYRPWDLATTLRDLSFDMAKHVRAQSQPTLDEIKLWHDWVFNAAPVYWALESACEDLIEEGVSDARVDALKQALTHAMGQAKYWPRKDRW